MRQRLPSAPGPFWLWVLICTAFVLQLGFVRVRIFPDQIVPLAYGFPLLIFLWRRDLRLLWGVAAGSALILVAKTVSLALADRAGAPSHLLFGTMELLGIAVAAVAVHATIVLSRQLEDAMDELERSNTELETTNEELAAREEEIIQQNEELQSQATELEHQAEHLQDQTEVMRHVNERLTAQEAAMAEMISLSAAGLGEQEILDRLGSMLGRLFAPRSCAAAILIKEEVGRDGQEGGAGEPVMTVRALFGLAESRGTLPVSSTLADIIAVDGRPGYLPDVTLRPDIRVPLLADGGFPRSLIAAPATLAGTTVVLEIYGREPSDWDDLELQLMQWCADQVAKVWTIARLREDLARLADSERAARARAERSTRDRDDFVAMLAHELRTPISATLGWATILRTIARDSKQFEQGVEVIERTSRQQARLISDLLDISRAARGKLEIALLPMPLVQAVDAALDVVTPAAEAKKICLVRRVETDVAVVLGDADRLQQVIWNILNNAVKFTPEGGTVTIHLSSDGTHARITVTDTGRGIAPDVISDVFDRYRQADSTSSRPHGGLGLGLAIVKHLLELHGGNVELHSPGVGQGTTCVITMPLHLEPAEKAHEKASRFDHVAARAALADLSVVIVDDDPDTLEFIRSLLTAYGATVASEAAAPAALDRIENVRPGLLISDIGMAGMDGYELIRRIRHHEDESIRRVPAIAVTAFARPEDRTRALLSGFQLHLSKPIEAADLVTAIARIRSTT